MFFFLVIFVRFIKFYECLKNKHVFTIIIWIKLTTGYQQSQLYKSRISYLNFLVWFCTAIFIKEKSLIHSYVRIFWGRFTDFSFLFPFHCWGLSREKDNHRCIDKFLIFKGRNFTLLYNLLPCSVYLIPFIQTDQWWTEIGFEGLFHLISCLMLFGILTRETEIFWAKMIKSRIKVFVKMSGLHVLLILE